MNEKLKTVSGILIAAGMALVSLGCGMVSPPLGMVVGGFFTLAVGMIVAP